MAKKSKTKMKVLVLVDEGGFPLLWSFTTKEGKDKAIFALWNFLDKESLLWKQDVIPKNPQEQFNAELTRMQNEVMATYLPEKVPTIIEEKAAKIGFRYQGEFDEWYEYCQAEAAYKKAKNSKSANVKWKYLRDFLPFPLIKNAGPYIYVDIVSVEEMS